MTFEEEIIKKIENLICVNGAMYFGSVEQPCSGRETGECCLNEQTFDEAKKELVNFILSSLSKQKEMIRGEVEKEIDFVQTHSKGNYADGKVEAFNEVLKLLDNN